MVELKSCKPGWLYVADPAHYDHCEYFWAKFGLNHLLVAAS